MNKWVNQWINEWISDWMNEWMKEIMNEWMNDVSLFSYNPYKQLIGEKEIGKWRHNFLNYFNIIYLSLLLSLLL